MGRGNRCAWCASEAANPRSRSGVSSARRHGGRSQRRQAERRRRMLDCDGQRRSCRRAQFVFACGPWLPRLFPELLGKRIQVPGRDVLYFGTPAGDSRFTFPNFPNYSEDRCYGFSNIDERGFKVCATSGSTSFDPDTDERIVTPHEVRRARAYSAEFSSAAGSTGDRDARLPAGRTPPDEHFHHRKPILIRTTELMPGAVPVTGFKHGTRCGRIHSQAGARRRQPIRLRYWCGSPNQKRAGPKWPNPAPWKRRLRVSSIEVNK